MNETSNRKMLLNWLLEEENPPIRYRTLTELLNSPENDREVETTKKTIPTYTPLAALLAAQKPAGYWGNPDYYLPKKYSTFSVLTVLADLGLTNENDQVRRGCEYLFSHQREDGQFCRRRLIAGQGKIWEAHAATCTHARIVRFLIRFGYGEDPRTRQAIHWLLATQRPDAMWLCSRDPRGHGCLRATLDFLRMAVLDPPTATHPTTERAAKVICGLLMQPGMGHYHVNEAWTRLVYPYFNYGMIPALDALGRLGFLIEHPKIRAAIDYLSSRRLPDGSWPLDEGLPLPPLIFGAPGKPNKWLTLDALRVFQLFGLA
jgi:hypothetical protein